MTYEIAPVPELPDGMGYEYALSISGWHRGDRNPTDAPEPVAVIRFGVETFDAEFIGHVDELGPQEGAYTVWYRLGRRTAAEVEALLARLAASGLCDTMFAPVERTYRQGQLVLTVGEAVAEWIASQDVAAPEVLPAGWARYMVASPQTARVYSLIAPAGDTPAAAALAARWTSVQGLAVWPDEGAGQIVVTSPDQFMEALEGLQRRGITFLPGSRRELVAAIWRAGGHNINAISRALAADRKTIYADLRAAGIDPTIRA